MNPPVSQAAANLLEALILQGSASWRSLERLRTQANESPESLDSSLLSALCVSPFPDPELGRASLTTLAQRHHRSACALALSRSLLALAQEELLLDDNAHARITLRQALASSVHAVASTGVPLPAQLTDQMIRQADLLEANLSSQLDLAIASRAQTLPAQLVLVLGMHRSGTSALAGLLVHAGLDGPNDSMPASPSNPRGYWESLSVVALNDQLLAKLGCHWFNVWSLSEGVWEIHRQEIGRWRADLLQRLQSLYPAGGRAVLKDPRLCSLLPGLHPWLESSAISSVVFLPIRHPQEVAASLNVADRIPLRKTLLLWLSHVLEAERHSRSLPRMIINHETLIGDPQSIVAGAAGVLAQASATHPLPAHWNPEAAIGFIDPQLHRQQHSADVPAWVQQEEAESLYSLALRVHAVMVNPQLEEQERTARMDELWYVWKTMAP